VSDAPKPIPQISPTQLKARLDAGENLFILDVRNPDEFEVCTLPNAMPLPLPQLQHAAREVIMGARTEETLLGGVPMDQTIIVYCHHGTRSAYAIMMLREIGYYAPDKLLNLEGGIDAWAAEVDPKMARY
jgi:adenylyltransferase/sulfurtransferase